MEVHSQHLLKSLMIVVKNNLETDSQFNINKFKENIMFTKYLDMN